MSRRRRRYEMLCDHCHQVFRSSRRDARLKRIAEYFREANETDGMGVTELIEEREAVGRRRAYDLIVEARKAGFLSPASKGRKRKRGKDE